MDKRTPLHRAAGNGHLEICKYILSKVEDKNLALNSKSNFNETPIDMANQFGHQKVVDYLKSVIEN